MKKLTLALGAAALALVAAGGAVAQQAMKHGHMGGPMGNETVSRADAEARAGTMFDRMDANHDGKLDAADRAAQIGAQFDRMDADHNGALTRDEFIAAHQRPIGPGTGGMGSGMGGGAMAGGMDGHKPGGMRMMRGMGMMQGMDANQDRTITRAEFIAGALKRFDAADANHDGKVTPEERRGAMKARMGEMRGHRDGAPPPR